MANFDLIELVPSAAVATDGTMTFTYPSGNASRYAKSGEKLIVSGLNNVLDQAADTFTLAYGASSVVVTYKDATSIPAGTKVTLQAPLADKIGVQVIPFYIELADVAADGDIVSAWTPGFAGKILSVDFMTTVAVTTASKRADFNLEIGSTNVTGGVVSVTSAAATPKGTIIAGTAITGANTFAATDTVSIEAASVTAHAEGKGILLVKVQNLDTLNAIEAR